MTDQELPSPVTTAVLEDKIKHKSAVCSIAICELAAVEDDDAKIEDPDNPEDL